MKHLKFYLLPCLLLTGCNNIDTKLKVTLQKSEEGEYTYLNIDTFNSVIEDEGLVLFESSICGHCEDAKDVYLTPFMKDKKVSIYSFVINELSDEDKSVFEEKINEKKIFSTGVPFLFTIKKGKYINGENDYEKFINFIKDYCIYE